MHARGPLRGITPWDLALTGALVVGAAGQTLVDEGDQVLLRAVLAAVTVAGLLLRRTAPGISAAWVSLGMAVQSLVTESPDQVGVLLAVIISAFSVAAWAPLREAVTGLVVLAVSVSLAIAVDPSDDPSNIAPTLLMFLAIPAGAGFAFNRRGRDLGALVRKAEALEREAQLAVGAERRRIARELHDVVSHAVTLIAVQAEAGQATIDDDPEAARRSLAAIGAVSRDAMAELHALLGLLSEDDHARQDTAAEPHGLDALPMLVTGVRAAGVEVEMIQEGPPPCLRPEVDLCAYRVVQEGLTNALRHSRQPAVTVRIESQPAAVRIHVDSTGPAHRSSYGGGGRGINGLRQRVDELGGTLESGPLVGDRFSLRVMLPQEVP